MPYTGIVLIIVALAFCALVLAVIPAILAVKRIIESITWEVQDELKTAIHELSAVLPEIKTIRNRIAEHTSDVKRLMSALGETGASLHAINLKLGTVTSILTVVLPDLTPTRSGKRYRRQLPRN